MNILGGSSQHQHHQHHRSDAKFINKENNSNQHDDSPVSRPQSPLSTSTSPYPMHNAQLSLFNQPEFASLLLQQQQQHQQQQQQQNPFMMNPFLAAAAAASLNGSSNSNGLLNNISNLAMLSNFNTGQMKSQQENFWPWLNMAAMSALYGGNGPNNNSNPNAATAALAASNIESKF
jgi:hypothetical protein